jgi:hypothetical protein
MGDLEGLDGRVKKVEKSSGTNILLQSLNCPVILALLGVYFSHQIENSKLETQRVQVAEAMVPILFSGNHAQALVTEKLLTQVVDPTLAAELNHNA